MRKNLWFALLLMLLPASALATTAGASAWTGTWQASASNGAVTIPFRFVIAETKGHVEGRFFNGDDAFSSQDAQLHDVHLVLNFDSFARVLDLHLQPDGSFTGTYAPLHGSASAWNISAHRAVAQAKPSAEGVPSIAGLWIIPGESKKHNEHAFRFIAHQDGAGLSASILRVGGDTGALTGVWKDGRWDLSNFSGTRAELATVSAAADGTLSVTLRDIHGHDTHYTAYRPGAARKLGLPDAPDLAAHTTVRDPDEVFAFSFKDLDGKTVSNTDPRFRNKVVLVDISGSWCPNCHDEAPFLDALYRKYHARGLEIVTLDFEDADDIADPARLRAFVKKYAPSFPVLLAGTTDQAQEKLPQTVNLDAWPTTFFIARDGRVKHVHAGFSAPATGKFHSAIEQEFDSQIEALLKQG